MSQEAVERFLGRLLTDDTFRKRAEKSTVENACREGGYDLNASEAGAINHDDIARLNLLSQQLDGSIKRFRVNSAQTDAVPPRSQKKPVKP